MKIWKAKLPPFRKNKVKVFKKAGEVGNFIYQIGEFRFLRQPSKDVSVAQIKSKEFQRKIKYLKDCLIRYRKLTGKGRGITAVQVGIPEKFSVIYTPRKLIVIINPKITKKSDKKYKYPEMCMSANPIIAPIIRPAWIEVEYYDENGILQHWDTKDDTKHNSILNRVFQHEIDHMEGLINIDIVTSSRELILESDPKFYDKAKFEEV